MPLPSYFFSFQFLGRALNLVNSSSQLFVRQLSQSHGAVVSHLKQFCHSFINQNECINTFKECKKKEDKSVESVYYCMHDHSMPFINQTTESLGIKLYIQFYLIHFDKYRFFFQQMLPQRTARLQRKEKQREKEIFCNFRNSLMGLTISLF